jgi:hypothetical protein
MVKAKKGCGFKYLLSHKAVNKRSEVRDNETLKCLTHTHELPKPVFVQSTRQKYCGIPNTPRPSPQNAELEKYPI